MSEPEPGCRRCRHFAAELALDVLPGRERGDALRHLDDCSRCRDAVHALVGTADQLIELVPEARPPDGFERKVVAALTASSGRRRGWLERTAALLGGVALIASGWLALPRQGSADPTGGAQPGVLPVRYAPLLSRHQEVGHAYLYPGDPPWIYLSVATPPTAPGTNVSCEAVRQDGATSSLGPLNRGEGGWTVPTPRQPDPVVAARLVDQSGHTVAMARFAPSPKPAARPLEPAPPDHSPGSDHSDQSTQHDHSNHVDDHSGGGSDNGHGGSGGNDSGGNDSSHN
ncbi:MAG: hypothetical protein J2P19_35455, partial [Pseudonocardia sp.]|nr:hypothetical protein [Pseudonocardia sp.]